MKICTTPIKLICQQHHHIYNTDNYSVNAYHYLSHHFVNCLLQCVRLTIIYEPVCVMRDVLSEETQNSRFPCGNERAYL